MTRIMNMTSWNNAWMGGICLDMQVFLMCSRPDRNDVSQ